MSHQVTFIACFFLLLKINLKKRFLRSIGIVLICLTFNYLRFNKNMSNLALLYKPNIILRASNKFLRAKKNLRLPENCSLTFQTQYSISVKIFIWTISFMQKYLGEKKNRGRLYKKLSLQFPNQIVADPYSFTSPLYPLT